jgi:hypothetical protein
MSRLHKMNLIHQGLATFSQGNLILLSTLSAEQWPFVTTQSRYFWSFFESLEDQI